MENDSLLVLKQQYIAAMSLEMKLPLQRLLGLSNSLEGVEPQAAHEIENTTRYLLGLVDELLEFARTKP